ncbi:hypothetical protein EDC04DRAFT_2898562 [Pisolithus marmoratus]|nr:hypothetical protein EDC04DRAFT_2898562 [Pisolithus marmoratus]
MSESGPEENRLTSPSDDEEFNNCSNFYLNSEEEMDTRPPHDLNDGLEDQMGTPPSPQQYSIASSQNVLPQQSAPQHAASSQSGPCPSQQPTFEQSQQPRLKAAPEHTQDPLLACSTGQQQESISSHQPIVLQGHRVQNGPPPCNDEQVGVYYDINASHHSQNHHPHPPSPMYLEDAGDGEKHHSKKQQCNVAGHTQDRLHSEDNDGSGNNSTFVSECHAFFGPLWCKLLDEVKRRMQLYIAMEVPFLCHEMAINSICMETLVETVTKYEEDGLELKAGYYPEHKRSMVMILYNDMQTFHSEIKKATVHIVPFKYCLYPPKNIKDNAKWIKFIKKKAMQLLKGMQYLCGDVDLLGRASTFAHPALKKICLAVYYCTSSKLLHQFVTFQVSVPDKALALIAAIICHSQLSSYLLTWVNQGSKHLNNVQKAWSHQE